jgi:hypothetical protein
MTAEESLRIVRRGLAREMMTIRLLPSAEALQRPERAFVRGYRLGYIRAVQSTGKRVKRIINTLACQQKEGAGE